MSLTTKKVWPRPDCVHSWKPRPRQLALADCSWCGSEARWSYVLGCYVRLIPASHHGGNFIVAHGNGLPRRNLA